MQVGFIPSDDVLNRTGRRATNLFSLLQLDHLPSPALRHQGSYFSSLQTGIGIYTVNSSGFQVFELRLNYITTFPGSSACRKYIMGFLSLHNHVEPTSTINLLYISQWSCCLENPNTHTYQSAVWSEALRKSVSFMTACFWRMCN